MGGCELGVSAFMFAMFRAKAADLVRVASTPSTKVVGHAPGFVKRNGCSIFQSKDSSGAFALLWRSLGACGTPTRCLQVHLAIGTLRNLLGTSR